METTKDLYFSKEHTWIKIENEIGIVGISHFAQSELGEIVYVDLPNIGVDFNQDDVFGSLEALKTVSDLFMPLSGEIIELNDELMDNPTYVNDKPFTNGWMVKIKIKNPEELKNLLDAKAYQQFTENTTN